MVQSDPVQAAFQLLPILLLFVLGIGLRRSKTFGPATAQTTLRLVFYLTTPALLVRSFAGIKLDRDLFILPLLAIVVHCINGTFALLVSRKFDLPRPVRGTMIVAAMILNTSFLFPFVLIRYGAEGFVKAAMFDLGNALMIYTFVYALACRYGQNGGNSRTMLKKIVTLPALWAILLGLGLNLSSTRLAEPIEAFLDQLGGMTIPLTLISIGLLFEPRLTRIGPTLATIGLRMFGGFILGLVLCELFALNGLDRSVVILSCAAPIGFNTVVFATLEGLDETFAAALLSLSILLGMISTSIMILYF